MIVIILKEKRNCALLKTKLNINIKSKCIYCVQLLNNALFIKELDE